MMEINGQPAMAGTIVVRSDETAEIDLPIGSAEIRFDPLAAAGVQFNGSLSGKATFTFGGPGNTLGDASAITLPLSAGGHLNVTFVVYLVGTATAGIYVVHYTAA